MKSKRLEVIANMVSTNSVLDVGCDHGKLSIYLYQNLGINKVIASDINQNALNNAIKNIKDNNLEDKIIVKLCDGINGIEDDIFTIIIAGMGFNTIKKILSKKKLLNNVKEIIIQSNTEVDKLRLFMMNNGYLIKDEKIVFDNKKYYIVIKFIKGHIKYNKRELLYGPLLVNESNNIDYFKYLNNKYIKRFKNIPNKNIILKLKLKKQIKILTKIIS